MGDAERMGEKDSLFCFLSFVIMVSISLYFISSLLPAAHPQVDTFVKINNVPSPSTSPSPLPPPPENCSISADLELIIYNRIGKAGSTSLVNWIMTTKKDDVRVIQSPDTEHERLTSELEEKEIQEMAKIIEHIKIIDHQKAKKFIWAGHKFFMDFDSHNIHMNKSYITMLRKPGERYLSQFYYWRTLPGLFGQQMRDRNRVTLECYQLFY